VLALVGLLSWHASRRVGVALLFVALLWLIGCFGLWDKLMQTFALMVVATVISVALGVPLGILAAGSATLRRILLPVLDVMQTLPSFVYLIPVLMLFGLGKVPAILATVVYALPPLIRLTDLGIRHVDGEIVEAARAFGTTRLQLLFGVQLPLARPSIMAGINQTTMMALSMVVIASMIGSRDRDRPHQPGLRSGTPHARSRAPGQAAVAHSVPPRTQSGRRERRCVSNPRPERPARQVKRTRA
jgi:glycine betaine/proline transport system permease protein